MAGAYCKFCDHRCFVERVIPGGPRKGWTGHLATCRSGKEYDRAQFGGFDADTALNPVTQPLRVALVRRIVEAERAITDAVAAGNLSEELVWRGRLDDLQCQFEQDDEEPDADPADVRQDFYR
jgi:hypothetical protein